MFAMGPGFFGHAAASYATLTLTGMFAAATVGVAYSSSIPISGGLEPYALTGGTGVASGALDSGFSLTITGTTGARFLTLSCSSPATADTMTFTASVDSSDGQTATSAQSVVVGDAQSILDMLATQPVAAYSLRKLRSAYAGAAVKVSRSSPSALLDIGFDASGNLDSAALLAFLGSSTGTIDTWYDQSGNGLHVTAVASAQPRIAAGGVVDAFNGVPALYFDGANYLSSTAASTLISATGWSANAVAEPTVYAATPQTILDQDNYPTAGKRIAQFLRFSSTAIEAVAFNTAPTAFVADSPANSPAVLTAICSTSGVAAYGDGAAGSTVAFSGAMNTTPAAFRVGQSLVNGGSTSLAGKCCEVVAFSAPLSTTDRHTLERDQGAYYGVAVA